MFPFHRPFQNLKPSGFSLSELLTTIAVLGILSGIALQSYRGVQTSARESVAHDNLALLNRALLHFEQTNWDIVLNPISDATSDELAVLRTLQWRNPVAAQATPGSPYLSASFSNTMSSSTQDYRIQWNGHVFELLVPGTPGSGIRTGELTSSSSTPPTYSDDYQPLGPTQHE